MNPAPAKGIQSLPTPVIDDVIITEVVNAWKGDYQRLEYGTMWDSVPHGSQQGSFPEHKLVFQQVSSEDGQWVKRIWANDRVNQDSYNYAIKYSAGSLAHPIYTRTYIVPRDGYTPLPDGTPDTLFPTAVLVDEMSERTGNELDSKYITVTRVYETLPGPEVPTKRYNQRGDLETVIVQTVGPNTQPDPDGLLVTGSQVEQVEVGKGVKTTSTVPDHSLLLIKEKKEGLLGETITTDDIVVPSTEPDALSESVVASVVQQTSATKAVKRTTTSNGPTQLDGGQNKSGLLGRTQIEEKIVPSGTEPDPLSFTHNYQTGKTSAVIQSEVTPIDSAKSKKTTITSTGPRFFKSSVLVDSPTGSIVAEKENFITNPINYVPSNDLYLLKYSSSRIDSTKLEVETHTVSNWPEVQGVDYDEVLNMPIRYSEKVVSPREYDDDREWTSINDRSYKPIDESKSLRKKYNRSEIINAFLDQYYSVQTQVQISLPNKLLGITAYIANDYSEGRNKSESNQVGGDAYGYTTGGGFKSAGSVSADLYFRLENGFSGYINGAQHIFFMPIDENGRVNKTILSELNDRDPDKNYQNWPNIKRITENVVVFTGGKSKTTSISKSEDVNINGFANSQRTDESFDIDTNVNTVTLPDALHGDIYIDFVTIGPNIPEDLQITGGVYPQALRATNPPSFPVGNYLISSSMDLYKWGVVKVVATTVNITSEYV